MLMAIGMKALLIILVHVPIHTRRSTGNVDGAHYNRVEDPQAKVMRLLNEQTGDAKWMGNDRRKESKIFTDFDEHRNTDQGLICVGWSLRLHGRYETFNQAKAWKSFIAAPCP